MSSLGTSPKSVEYASLIEHAPVAMIMSDASGRIMLVNKEAEVLFGYSRKKLIGKAVDLLVPSRSRAAHPKLRSSYIQAPELRAMGAGRDLHALHQNGTEIPVEIGLRPIQAPEGTFVLSTISDITERRRSEQVTARLAAIVTSAQVAMMAYTTEGIITDWNPAAERLYEYNAEEMIGQSVYRLIPSHVESETFELMKRVSRGETVESLETDRLRKSGDRVRVSLTLSPIQAPDGTIMGISSIAHDIGRRVALEQQLRQTNQALAERTQRLSSQARELKAANLALEQSNRELQQFAYVASHDLQAPLRSINGFLQLLREDYADALDAQAQDWIQRVLESVAKLQLLIKDLLAYARVGSRGDSFSTVDLSAVFDDTIRLFASTVEESGAQITCDELPIVLGDAAQLGRMLENFIDNSLKYRSDERPAIRLGVADEGDHWRFSISDNGIGIDPEFHEQIFDVFRRLHADADYPGTGIGLAICRRVIQRHGGALWLDSSEGQGSTFHFTLPKHRERQA